MNVLQRLDPQAALRYSTMIAAVLLAVLAAVIVNFLGVGWGPFWAVIAGMIAGVLIGFLTEIYTSGKPVTRIAESCQTGAATNIIAGLAVGLESTVLPVVAICGAIWIAFASAARFSSASSAESASTLLSATISFFRPRPRP